MDWDSLIGTRGFLDNICQQSHHQSIPVIWSLFQWSKFRSSDPNSVPVIQRPFQWSIMSDSSFLSLLIQQKLSPTETKSPNILQWGNGKNDWMQQRWKQHLHFDFAPDQELGFKVWTLAQWTQLSNYFKGHYEKLGLKMDGMTLPCCFGTSFLPIKSQLVAPKTSSWPLTFGHSSFCEEDKGPELKPRQLELVSNLATNRSTKPTIFSLMSSATVTGWGADLAHGLPAFLLFSCSKSNSSSLLKSLSFRFPLIFFFFIPPFPETAVTFLGGIFNQKLWSKKEETCP